jgi:hypothetical protein
MASTTVTGRVRATVRLKIGDGDADNGAQVVTVSWASDRMFPRTRGVGVTFELQTADGVVLRVEPFEALVTLPVRRTVERDGVRREDAWIAIEDELTIDGELDAGDVATIHARRIALAGPEATVPMRLPPGALTSGEIVEIVSATPPGDLETPLETPPETAVAGDAPEPATEAASEPALTKRSKKKRPDSSGTPTPIQ